ncbi:hypothetical protein HMPREF1982_02147 [Clostridiales bacterium oral taxon 876 str. F0540]|nr:hypothetical protein HMPREF1982_02147 [Clostridiales bacterium oral taxon 876 str. F0540]
MRPYAIVAILGVILMIINLYLIAMDKVKPSKSSMLINNFIILLYLIGSALEFLR